jgi:hypothetical protein
MQMRRLFASTVAALAARITPPTLSTLITLLASATVSATTPIPAPIATTTRPSALPAVPFFTASLHATMPYTAAAAHPSRTAAAGTSSPISAPITASTTSSTLRSTTIHATMAAAFVTTGSTDAMHPLARTQDSNPRPSCGHTHTHARTHLRTVAQGARVRIPFSQPHRSLLSYWHGHPSPGMLIKQRGERSRGAALINSLIAP